MESVISDFNLICLGQKRAVKCKGDNIAVDSFNCNRRRNRIDKDSTYGQWSILTHLYGVWYNIYPKVGNEYDYEKGFFDLLIKEKESNQKCDCLNEKNSFLSCANLSCDKLNEIIDFYIDLSPLNKICVMFGLNRDEEAIVGVMTINEFLRKLQNNEISFDVTYVISK